MTIEEQIERMKHTKRLHLKGVDVFRHFRLAMLFLIIPIMNVYYITEAYLSGYPISERLENMLNMTWPCLFGALFIGYLFYDMIRFKSISVSISVEYFEKMAQELCMENGWDIDYLEKGCMIAYGGVENEGQKIVLIRTENEIRVNSLYDIENVKSGFWPSLNKKHIRKVEEKIMEYIKA